MSIFLHQTIKKTIFLTKGAKISDFFFSKTQIKIYSKFNKNTCSETKTIFFFSVGIFFFFLTTKKIGAKMLIQHRPTNFFTQKFSQRRAAIKDLGKWRRMEEIEREREREREEEKVKEESFTMLSLLGDSRRRIRDSWGIVSMGSIGRRFIWKKSQALSPFFLLWCSSSHLQPSSSSSKSPPPPPNFFLLFLSLNFCRYFR
ncbi:LOW QUALITY PROTEIN: hypothetical protein TorRG33x02_121590 [Trema orientale]|uniref:Uncharacterized protein n=1 Tax=Trema orientale TaxID=63057 RepID=A0A2P5F2R7_TREOI|nr:LOW QUALITY PROTEIN: hypothetical protein TorRG33x02_121590 [Trema orientale]